MIENVDKIIIFSLIIIIGIESYTLYTMSKSMLEYIDKNEKKGWKK